MNLWTLSKAVIMLGLLIKTGCAVDPLSKVTIKSLKATTTPLSGHRDHHLIRYAGSVSVELADKTIITGNQLDVVMLFGGRMAGNGKKSTPDTPKESKAFRSIVMRGEVIVKRLNHEIKADSAELDVIKKRCVARGHVCIMQKKESDKDVPLTVNSRQAEFDLTSEKLLLVGSAQEPVSTVIEFSEKKT